MYVAIRHKNNPILICVGSKKIRMITITHIAQNIVKICQKYFQYSNVIEILSQHFHQILQNISSQNYNFNFLKYF